MSAAALEHTYRYAFPSGPGPTAAGPGLRLATCSADLEQPHFFEGRLRKPGEAGRMLLALADVVGTHFFLPTPPNLDPVVTSNEAMLRFEGFSGCCGVYARVDLPPEAFDRDLAGRGTTNVDFNSPMRAALSRLRDADDDARLAVGADEVALSKGGGAVVEKRVKLPVRWIKGFCEVAAYAPLLELKLEVDGAEGRRFIRSLPATPLKRPGFVVRSGRSIRLSQREAKGAVRVAGTHRLRVVEPLLAGAKSLRAWQDDASGTTAWQVAGEAGAMFLLLSPEVYRGFSGEGQALSRLAGGRGESALPAVRAQLQWQSQIAPADLAAKANATADEVSAALAVLASRGLAGYDAAAGCYFHRELPFDLSAVESLQPRLVAARKLLAEGKAAVLSRDGEAINVEVDGTGVRHHVRLRPDREGGDKCTCPWFSKYLGGRGPCKHVLAARLLVEGEAG